VKVQEHVTTALDTLGILLIAAAPLLALWPVMGGWATGPAGAAVLAGSWWADGGLAKLKAKFRGGQT